MSWPPPEGAKAGIDAAMSIDWLDFYERQAKARGITQEEVTLIAEKRRELMGKK